MQQATRDAASPAQGSAQQRGGAVAVGWTGASSRRHSTLGSDDRRNSVHERRTDAARRRRRAAHASAGSGLGLDLGRAHDARAESERVGLDAHPADVARDDGRGDGLVPELLRKT